MINGAGRERSRATWLLVATSMLVLSLACVDRGPSAPTTLSSGNLAASDRFTPMTYDELLLSIGEQVPGFGGFYPQNGEVVVLLQNPTRDAEAATNAINEARKRALRAREVMFAIHSQAQLSFAQAKYSFVQLHTWKQALYATPRPEGTAFSGIDKRNNRIAIGVRDEAARNAWEATVERAAVPMDAVAIQVAEGLHFAADTLRKKVRPTVGGVQLGDPNTCSLGTNVRYRPDSSYRYFITASHCSTTQWTTDAAIPQWTQAETPDTVADIEYLDPSGFTGGACPSGKTCRYTDITLVKYRSNADWQFGKLARASGSAPWPIAELLSVTEQPFLLWEWPVIKKTGRTTGTTTNPDTDGDETDYCYDYDIGGNKVLLCQIEFPTGFTVSGGDSGGPVWGQYGEQQANHQAFLVGLVSGGGTGYPTIVTPVGYVAYDFGYDENGTYIDYFTCIGFGIC